MTRRRNHRGFRPTGMHSFQTVLLTPSPSPADPSHPSRYLRLLAFLLFAGCCAVTVCGALVWRLHGPRVSRAVRGAEAILVPGGAPLPTLRILPQGISRKRLEQAVRDLQLPVEIAHEVDEADVVMTLKNEYKQKTPLLREAEERALPIYVLKANTIPQMQSSLTSIFSLEIDPREAAMRETEEAIGIVINQSEPVELSPQNAYIRRLQHQMAERANLVSRSRGREPYRRVRLYPDAARSGW